MRDTEIKEWVPDATDEEVAFLIEEFMTMDEEVDDPCVDNYRACISNTDKDYSDKYEEALSHGCCGYEDKLITAPSGRIFSIGCNYGH